MTIDMSQFYEVFFEESAELLAEMERLLLDLDVAAPGADDLNAIFRTAHSIKGGSAAFGFTEITETTHILESLLDKLRNAQLAMQPAMVDAFLEAVDVLRMQLGGRQFGGEVDGQAVSRICRVLAQLADPATPESSSQANAPADATKTEKQALDTPTKEGAAIDPSFENLYAILTEDDSADDGAAASSNATCERTPAATSQPGYGLHAEVPCVDEPGAVRVDVARPSASAPESAAIVEIFAAVPKAVPRAAERTDAESSSIRVSIEKVDQLINIVGELVITQAMLGQAGSSVDPIVHAALLNGLAQLERNTRDLQESVMSIRMMPISFVFSRFPRVVRDLAGKLDKQVELKTVGEGTELDKGLIEKIADPLNHLVRNCLDHGLERPEQRIAAGKDPKGTITLSAFHRGGNIIIEVSDDGAGLDRARILAKAAQRGFPVHDGMSDDEVWQLIFEPGFSTVEVVTDVSGRGVGMDVVKRNIRGMGGTVEIVSRPGEGTCFSIRLPLTLAILDGMSIAVGQETFIIPLTYIVESLQPSKKDLKTIAQRSRVIQVRGEHLPVLVLHELFKIRPDVTDMDQGIMVILECDGEKLALFVDALVGQHQVVIKSLETNYRRVEGVSGATIMGDGRVALILDVAALLRLSQCESLAAA